MADGPALAVQAVPALRVLEPGWQSLVVDFGRPGARSLGVPVGGAADRHALVLGNALVGNPPNTTALEISLTGPHLEVLCPLAGVVYGASFALASSRQTLRLGTTFNLQPGERIRVGGVASGLRAYLCVPGGFATPLVLGSRSALTPLTAGDVLHAPPSTLPTRFIRPRFTWDREPGTLRCLPGPQADWFRLDELHQQQFTVTPASNRMGLRLRGQPLTVSGRELVSEPVCPGSVQVTHEGQCIILGVDGQTIGGYPKIAQVITADLDKLGQLRPGDALRLVPVRHDEAEAILRQKEAEMSTWVMRLRVTLPDRHMVVSL
ncbi:MAG: biotin-dependent carboxyltransferase family protein [Gemmataceae bacterium]|nr:biotin-dependent carboxyltransferase family protein [Gemmataceae bacterium]MDW8266586.1 biotin-dependent carboxyltransferase family protein [Gemmataceae bacterium]